MELVEDLDDTDVRVAVRVAHRVRRRFGERELQVGQQLVGERPQPGDPREGEPAERDVLRPRGDREPDGYGRHRWLSPWTKLA